MAGVMDLADRAYSVQSTWWLHLLAADVPFIACPNLEFGILEFYPSFFCWSVSKTYDKDDLLFCEFLFSIGG